MDYEELLNEMFQHLSDVQQDVYEGDLDVIDEKYFRFCRLESGEKIAQQIRNVDFTEFQTEINTALCQILNDVVSRGSSESNAIKAVYYEYDPVNSWDGYFFTCYNYNKIEADDDDWACDWEESIEGPSVPDFNDMGIEDWYLSSRKSLGKVVYAYARVIIAFAKACRSLTSPVPLCLAFHEQTPITRMTRDI